VLTTICWPPLPISTAAYPTVPVEGSVTVPCKSAVALFCAERRAGTEMTSESSKASGKARNLKSATFQKINQGPLTTSIVNCSARDALIGLPFASSAFPVMVRLVTPTGVAVVAAELP